MITARFGTAAGALSARLTSKARRIALARAERARRTFRGDGWNWRDARLLWPNFIEDR